MTDNLNPRAADRLVRAARAAHTLSETLWEALHEELTSPDGSERVAALSQRLADTAATVALLAGKMPPAQEDEQEQREQRERPEQQGRFEQQEQIGERDARRSSRTPAREVPAGGAFAREVPARGASAREASAREASARGASAAEPGPLGPAPSVFASSAVPVESERPRTAPAGPAGTAAEAASAVEAGEELRPVATLVDELAEDVRPVREAPEIEVIDQRGTEDRALVSVPAPAPLSEDVVESEASGAATPWIASIARRVERYERDRQSFAVMAIELVDIERLRHAELPGEVARLTGLVESALADELRPADSLMRESPGRYWLLAPETDPEGARALAGRLAEAVREAAEHRGEPLKIAVGVAVCPTDGLAPGALAAHADVGLYAARAAGRPLAP